MGNYLSNANINPPETVEPDQKIILTGSLDLTSSTDSPVTQEPVIQEPVTQESVTQEPVIQEPIVIPIHINPDFENIQSIDNPKIVYVIRCGICVMHIFKTLKSALNQYYFYAQVFVPSSGGNNIRLYKYKKKNVETHLSPESEPKQIIESDTEYYHPNETIKNYDECDFLMAHGFHYSAGFSQEISPKMYKYLVEEKYVSLYMYKVHPDSFFRTIKYGIQRHDYNLLMVARDFLRHIGDDENEYRKNTDYCIYKIIMKYEETIKRFEYILVDYKYKELFKNVRVYDDF
jgi:hypothetical protein